MYTLEDALVAAQYLAAFVRHADLVKMACVAQIVNVIAPILTRPDGVLLQTIYYPLLAFAQHMRGVSLTPLVDGPTYKAGERGEAPALDVSVSHEPATGGLCAVLVNRDRTRPLDVTLRLMDQRVTRVLGVETLTGPDLMAANTWEKPDAVKPAAGEARTVGGAAVVRVPGAGMAVVRMELEAR